MKKHLKKFKKPKLPANLSRVEMDKLSLRRTKSAEEKITEAISNVPRITNETVAEHREEVLSGARKYIYPLQHSKHRVVKISLALFVAVLVTFFVLCSLSLYRFQNTGGFIYDVTRIIPFPVAKAGGRWISYESYLFELRRNMHYYQTQQQANFSSRDGQVQLKRLKQQALQEVIRAAYVKQLAAKNGVNVTDQQVDQQVQLVRSQNRLGSNPRVFKEVLSEFWGWREADFKRELKQQMLQQAVVTKLDVSTTKRAQSALEQIHGGADFAAIAAQASDDLSTKGSGGQYPMPLTVKTGEVPPAITAEVFSLQPGQMSDIVNTGYTLEIIKTLEANGSNRKASHIQFNLAGIDTYVQPLEKQHPAHRYIKL